MAHGPCKENCASIYWVAGGLQPRFTTFILSCPPYYSYVYTSSSSSMSEPSPLSVRYCPKLTKNDHRFFATSHHVPAFFVHRLRCKRMSPRCGPAPVASQAHFVDKSATFLFTFFDDFFVFSLICRPSATVRRF